jgi:hypothetical protein
LTLRVENAAFDFQEALLVANTLRGRQRLACLNRADARLDCLRALLRLAYDLKLLAGNQLHFAALAADELGRLLGAWKKGTVR